MVGLQMVRTHGEGSMMNSFLAAQDTFPVKRILVISDVLISAH